MNEQKWNKPVRGETSLGIEFGATRIKAVLIDYNFETIASSSYEWENQLIDGYWTCHLNEMINGLQETYHQLQQEVENTYDVTLQKIIFWRMADCSKRR